MEWLILAVLVPATLIPVVLLWGYSGCGEYVDTSAPIGPPVTPPPPAGVLELKLEATGTREVTLTWNRPDPATAEFRIVRVREGDPQAVQFNTLVGADVLMRLDQDRLAEATTYLYLVEARTNTGTVLSASATVPVTTFQTVFGEEVAGFTGVTATQGTDQADRNGVCFVVRLPVTVAPPPRPWTKARVTIRGSTQGPLTLNLVSLSSPAEVDPALPKDRRQAWDSHTDLTIVSTNVTINAGTALSKIVDFAVQPNRDLLLAFDVTINAGEANVRAGVDVAEGAFGTFFLSPAAGGPAIAEAGVLNRSPFFTRPRHFFVERIEVV